MDAIINKFRKVPAQTHPANYTLINASGTVQTCYLLTKGTVRQHVYTESGEDISMHVYTPVSLFPLLPALTQQPNRHSFTTTTNVLVQPIPVKKALDIILSDPALTYRYLKRFAKGLDGISQRFENAHKGNLSSQLLSLLSFFGKKYGQRSQGKTIISPKLTHAEIGSWLGVSRETISRHMKLIQNKGKISYSHGEIILFD